MHEPGPEIRTLSLDGSVKHRWKQVAWQGQTGAIYGLHEKPSKHEPGSFAPLYTMVAADHWEPER